MAPSFQKTSVGNLTGLRSLEGRDPKFVQALEMALALNPHFEALSEARDGQEGVDVWEAWHPHLIWMFSARR